jgi:steroid 5-alpha reductase family enzyme
MLLLYWLPILIITSGQGQQFPSPLRAVVCVTLNILGSAVMMAADAQKFFTLAHQKGLITTGMFKYTRSPNFLGEIMIYFSFAHCVGTFEAYFIVVGAFVTVVFTFIVRKEASNRKKKGWEAYQQRSFLLLPKVVPSSSFLSYLIYAGIGISAYILMGE